LTPKVTDASVALVCGGGAEVIVVRGGVVSIVKARVAGVASRLPAGSVARTLTVWLPAASAAVVHGLAQVAHEALSTRHAKVEPAWSALNEKVGVVSSVGPLGPAVIAVSGAVVSDEPVIVHVRVAGDWSVLPAASVARTLNVWLPAARPV
jgi:hypothetical protein